MPEYMIFGLNRRRLVAYPLTLPLESDADAIAKAQTFLDDCDVVEVWEGKRPVAEIKLTEA